MAEEQEPSIEEILASIRQIISDDDDDDSGADDLPEPEEEEDDVLELTERVDVAPPPPPPPPPKPKEPEYEPEPPRVEIAMEDSPDDDDDDLGDSVLTSAAEAAAFQGFSKLASKTHLDRRGTGDTTIEDIVREMMKPMLREWLDIHLPPLIEKVVQRELRKVAQRAVDDE